MARIVLATMGSLGDLHPKIALGLELRERGHAVVINTWEGYREKIGLLGFEFVPLRPDVDPTDKELIRQLLDARKGPERIIKDLIFPSLHSMFEDVVTASAGADLLVTGEIVYVARSVFEKTGISWVSTSLAPLSMFSSHDPNVYATAEFLEILRPLPSAFHRALFAVMRWTISDWFGQYKDFRRDLGLSENHDTIFEGKYSDLLHLAMFSKAFGQPQPDWHQSTVQTGFCFYDGQSDEGQIPDGLQDFLDSGEPPIVFTLGSAAAMDAGNFFDESVTAAKTLGRRAVLLYGSFSQPPIGLDENVVGFEYAPYSLVFPRAACVVHQGGVGTTGQVLRAGVPQLIMPYAHDQPDNAARCRRMGVAEIIRRGDYNAKTAAKMIAKILLNKSYSLKAKDAAKIVRGENGTLMACDAIERVLRKSI